MIDEVLAGIITTLAKGIDEEPNPKNVRAKLQIVGFGSFELVSKPERAHRNPQNPYDTRTVVKPAHNKVKFNAGSTFKGEVN